MSFSAEQQKLLRLTLYGRDAREISNTISQSFAISEVNLDGPSLAIPPSSLAALPFILKNPKNLKYNRGIPATQEIIDSMIDLTYYQPDCTIKYITPSGRPNEIVLPACTSLKEFYQKTFSQYKLESDVNNLLLSRSIQNQFVLSLPICNLPIGIFHVPDAMWAIEYRNFPLKARLDENTIQMIRFWTTARLRNVNLPEPVLNDLKAKLEGFRAVVSSGVIPQREQAKFATFIDTINKDPKYAGIANRCYKIGDLHFSIQRNGKIMCRRGEHDPVEYDAKELTISTIDGGTYGFHFGNPSDLYRVTEMNIRIVISMCNFCILDYYEAYPERKFTFDFPDRSKSRIPRTFTDSRTNFIRDEKLEEVIKAQIEYGKKLC